MSTGLLAEVSIIISAPVTKVWDALIDPAAIKQYMFGSEVVTDWKQGSPIVWKGMWKDKPYEDKGTILRIEPRHELEYTHYSPLGGDADVPENYHTLTYRLSSEGEGTRLSLAQDGNQTEQAKEHSEKMWSSMLESIKDLLEK